MTFPTIGNPSDRGRWGSYSPGATTGLSSGRLPRADRVLAVTTRPGQESANLGGLLYAFRRSGASIRLLSLTRGEASGLNSTLEPLEDVRPWELQVAAVLLGISSVAVSDYPDGGLRNCQLTALTERIHRAIRSHSPDLLLVIDPADGDADTAVAAMAACAAADEDGIPVVARTLPAASAGWCVSLGADTATARAVQRSAVAAHRSQADGASALMTHLDQLGGDEWLRWLMPPAGRRPAAPRPAAPRPAAERLAAERLAAQHVAAQRVAAQELAGGHQGGRPGALQLVPRPRLAALRPL